MTGHIFVKNKKISRPESLEIPINQWSERRDLNSRPLPPQGSALPSCATSRERAFYARYKIFVNPLFLTCTEKIFTSYFKTRTYVNVISFHHESNTGGQFHQFSCVLFHDQRSDFFHNQTFCLFPYLFTVS